MSKTGTVARRRRVLLVDDHPIVRQGLRRMIEQEPDLEVCGEAGGPGEASQLLRELQPDVVVVDLSLREGDGIEIVKEVRAQYPAIKVLVLSMHDEMIYAERLLGAGASGYLMKHAASDQFLVALRRVLAGATYVSEAVGSRMIQKFATGRDPGAASPVDALSNRELQILQMIGRGLSTRQMAESLKLSVKTVESHRQRIKRKLELASGAQLVQYAVNWVSNPSGPARL